MPKGVKKSDDDKVRDAVRKMKITLRRAEKDLKWRTECEKLEKVQKDYLESESKGIKKLQERNRVRRIRVELGGSDYSGTKHTSRAAERLKYRSVPVSSCPALKKYKDKVKNKKFTSLQQELKELNLLMDNLNQLFTRTDWSYVYKRWNKVYGRINNPTPRFLVMGTLPGKVPKDKQKEIKRREELNNLKQLMEKELTNA